MFVVNSIFGCHAAMSRPDTRQPFLYGYEPTNSQHVHVCNALGYPIVAIEEDSNPVYITPDRWPKPSERSVVLSTAICLDTVCRRTIYTRETRAVFLGWARLPKRSAIRAERRLTAWLSWHGYLLKLAYRMWWGACLLKACVIVWSLPLKLRELQLVLFRERRRMLMHEVDRSLAHAILWLWPGRQPNMRDGWNCGY